MALSKDPEKRKRQLENLKGHIWKSGESGNPRGYSRLAREKNRINDFVNKIIGTAKDRVIETTGMTPEEVDAIEQKILSASLSEAQLIAKDNNTPLYMKNLAMAVIIDMKNGKTDTVDKLRERQYGKVKQQIELTGKNGQPLMKDPIVIEVIDNRDKINIEQRENNT